MLGTLNLPNESVTKPPMKRIRSHALLSISAALVAATLCASAAVAQERPGFLDNLFSRGEPSGDQQPQIAQGEPGELVSRVARLESALRQLTGQVEELQHQNQQLRMQLQQMGGQPAPGPNAPQMGPSRAPMTAPPPQRPDQRGDAFDPRQQPNAPGAPRTLGSAVAGPGAPTGTMSNIGAPEGRDAGAPLDLGSLAPQPVGPGQQGAAAPGPRLATLPPSAKPKDHYDLAYGYVLHKDYALAQQTFEDFLRRYPNDPLMPDAEYWLGESLFQQQNYTDAAKRFLTVATKYAGGGKAPESLLRLGQSLAALNKKEAACATLSEAARKFPRASASVKRGIAEEQKRAHC